MSWTMISVSRMMTVKMIRKTNDGVSDRHLTHTTVLRTSGSLLQKRNSVG